MASRLGLSTVSVVDAVTNALRDQILTQEISAGEPVTEYQVAELYSVARPSAKSALDRLVHEGLLRRSANKTARVPLLNQDDIRDLYATRTLIEKRTVSVLAHTRNVPSAANQAHKEFLAAIPEGSVTELVKADINLHLALVEGLRSPRMSRMYAAIIGEAQLCMAQVQTDHLLSVDIMAGEHEGILQAIKAGDEPLSETRLERHLERARERLLHSTRLGSKDFTRKAAR